MTDSETVLEGIVFNTLRGCARLTVFDADNETATLQH